MLPKYLVYWINSFPSQSCALVSTESDLLDGVAICELASFVGIRSDVPTSNGKGAQDKASSDVAFVDIAFSAIGRIRAVLVAMAQDVGGFDVLPLALRHADSAKRIVLSMTNMHVNESESTDTFPSSSSSSNKDKNHGSSKNASNKELVELLSFLYARHIARGTGTTVTDTATDTTTRVPVPVNIPSSSSTFSSSSSIKMNLSSRVEDPRNSAVTSSSTRTSTISVRCDKENVAEARQALAKSLQNKVQSQVQLLMGQQKVHTQSRTKESALRTIKAKRSGVGMTNSNKACNHKNKPITVSASTNFTNTSSSSSEDKNYMSTIDRDRGRDRVRVQFPLRAIDSRGRDSYNAQDTQYKQRVTAGSNSSSSEYVQRSEMHASRREEAAIVNIASALEANSGRETKDNKNIYMPIKPPSCPLYEEVHEPFISAVAVAAAPQLLSQLQSQDSDDPFAYIKQYHIPNQSELRSIANWLHLIGVQAKIPPNALSPTFFASDSESGIIGTAVAHVRKDDEHRLDRECDEWRNGIALSELAAIVVRTAGKSRQLVKQVSSFDQYGRPLRPRLLIAGTETMVSKRVQAIRNIHISLTAMRLNCEPTHLLSDVNPSAYDVFRGKVSVWAILKILYLRYGVHLTGAAVQPTVKNYTMQYGKAGHYIQPTRAKARSASPKARDCLHQVKITAAPAAASTTNTVREKQMKLRSRSLSPHPYVHFASNLEGEGEGSIQVRGTSHTNNVGTTGLSQGSAVNWDNNSGNLQNKKLSVTASISEQMHLIRSAVDRPNQKRSPYKAWDDTTSATYQRYGTSMSGSIDGADAKTNSLHSSRFRSSFPGDQDLNVPSINAAVNIPSSEMRRIVQEESMLEREAARKHMLKVRRNAHEKAIQDMNKDKLKQYAQDFVGAGIDDDPFAKLHSHTTNTCRVSSRPGSGVVQDGNNTSTTRKVILRSQHLKDIERAARYAQLGLSKLRVLQQQSMSWMPPVGDPAKTAALRKVPLVNVSARQIVAIREWMLSLGLSVLDGEGGYFFWDAGKGMAVHSYPAPPLPLSLDRLRNGQLLCSLLYVLEPAASQHAHLAELLHRGKAATFVHNTICTSSSTTQEKGTGEINSAAVAAASASASSLTIDHMNEGGISAVHAQENLDRCMWVLKLRRSPPIPEHLLVRSDDILKGSKDVLWGLLWEILQAYPYANDWAEQEQQQQSVELGGMQRCSDLYSSSEKQESTQSNAKEVDFEDLGQNTNKGISPGFPQPQRPLGRSPDFGIYPVLPYSSRDRRRLDQSLVNYIYSLGLVKPLFAEDEGQCQGPARATLHANAVQNINIRAARVPQSLAALETMIRNGTLLCALCEKVLGMGFVGFSGAGSGSAVGSGSASDGDNSLEGRGFISMCWNRSPHTYQQCLGNISKAVTQLRNMATGLNSVYKMSGRFLYSGCEESMIRGNWDTILGLFEDVRRCADKVEPRPTFTREIKNKHKVAGAASSSNRGNGYLADKAEQPYFGPYGVYTNTEHAWSHGSFAERVYHNHDQNRHYLPNRQYTVKTRQEKGDLISEMDITGTDGNKNSRSRSSNLPMSMPAKLNLNPLAWRGEETNSIGSSDKHKVDIVPNAGGISADMSIDSINGRDAMFNKDEMHRKIKNSDTGIDIATDTVNDTDTDIHPHPTMIIKENRGQEELEEEFRARSQNGTGEIFPSDFERLNAMTGQSYKNTGLLKNGIVSTDSADNAELEAITGAKVVESTRDSVDSWKFKRIYNSPAGKIPVSSITLSPNANNKLRFSSSSSSPSRPGHTVDTGNSSMKIQKMYVHRQTGALISSSSSSKDPRLHRQSENTSDGRGRDRGFIQGNSVYAKTDVGSSYPGRNHLVVQSISPPRHIQGPTNSGMGIGKSNSSVGKRVINSSQYSNVRRTASPNPPNSSPSLSPTHNHHPISLVRKSFSRSNNSPDETATPFSSNNSTSPRLLSRTPISPMHTQYISSSNDSIAKAGMAAAEDVFIRSSFHLSPTPLTPMATGMTPLRSLYSAGGSGTVTDNSNSNTYVSSTQKRRPSSSKFNSEHVYTTKGADYDDSASNISNSPGDANQPEEVEIHENENSSENGNSQLHFRNTNMYNPIIRANNRDNNLSKMNPSYANVAQPSTMQETENMFHSHLSSTGYLAMPSTSYLSNKEKDLEMEKGKKKECGGNSEKESFRPSWEEGYVPTPSKTQFIANTGTSTDTGTALDRSNIVHNKIPTMILSNSAPSVHRGVGSIVDVTRMHSANKIVRWLQSLGVLTKDIQMVNVNVHVGKSETSASAATIKRPSALEILSTFQDGVAFCRLVETLEYSGTLTGTVPYPTSSAQKLQNVRKALEKLANSSSGARIAPSQLMCSEDVCAGKTEVILILLQRIQKAYKNRRK